MARYHSLGDRRLLHFYSIDIEEQEGTQVVYFNSSIHVNKNNRMSLSFSMAYRHDEILRDRGLIRNINEKYGKVTVPDEAPF